MVRHLGLVTAGLLATVCWLGAAHADPASPTRTEKVYLQLSGMG